MEKQYFYSFAFIDTKLTATNVGSVYKGYSVKSVTLPQIEQAKKDAGVGENAVLLSCCYLGRMTRNEMVNGVEGHNVSINHDG
jgi:hypothetical protein